MNRSVGSQQSVVPSGLPVLPGNGFKDPTKTDFKKRHIFDVSNGITVTHDPAAEAPKGPISAVEPPKMMPKSEVSVAPVQPAWVAFDRKVLRFDCYFKESVHESRLENYRIRKCVLYYYLEDDSMHVSEPKCENSGIPQARQRPARRAHRRETSPLPLRSLRSARALLATRRAGCPGCRTPAPTVHRPPRVCQGERKGTVFLKRHRVPKPDGGFYGVGDLTAAARVEKGASGGCWPTRERRRGEREREGGREGEAACAAVRARGCARHGRSERHRDALPPPLLLARRSASRSTSTRA
tara:strand:- start:2096 stop:2986 length:891 start_codon:yes stop_codon:yes gene_type:complete